jgi:hypothetical protein
MPKITNIELKVYNILVKKLSIFADKMEPAEVYGSIYREIFIKQHLSAG